MICPKCSATVSHDAESCDRCGIVFAKYQQRLADQLRRDRETELHAVRLAMPKEGIAMSVFGRFFVLVLLCLISWRLIPPPLSANEAGHSFLHMINLPFHEAGHLVFRGFGAVMHSLGGSLGQLLVPLICMYVLATKTHDAFGAAVCGWWFGENLLDIAPYIDDARSLSMPLLGGNTGESSPYGFHDWNFILSQTGLLRYDHTIATDAQYFGSGIMLLALLRCTVLLWQQLRER